MGAEEPNPGEINPLRTAHAALWAVLRAEEDGNEPSDE